LGNGIGFIEGDICDGRRFSKVVAGEKITHIILMQYVDDVAKTFIRCSEVPFRGAKTYNVQCNKIIRFLRRSYNGDEGGCWRS